MDTPEAKKPRMGVNAVVGVDDRRYEQAAALFAAGGYSDLGELQEIHCTKEACPEWIHNGFLQTFSVVKGEQCRVLLYFPGQMLQPHKHDLHEEFLITFGSADLWTWAEDGTLISKGVRKGDLMEVSPGTVHALRAGCKGLTFHELVGAEAFGKRSTEFMLPSCIPMPSVFQGKTVLVTGSNRGLGKGFAEALRKLGAEVVETCRIPSTDEQIALDLSSPESIAGIVERLAANGIDSLDYLINNAGISVPNHPIDPILKIDIKETEKVFQTNVFGTISLTNALLPLLDNRNTRVVMNMSSQLASIERCWGIQGRFGGVSSYRMARAALNMATRTFGGELKDEGYTFLCMSPGHVATDMGSAGGRTAPLTVEQSIHGMLQVLEKVSPEDNGRFLQYDGSELPW